MLKKNQHKKTVRKKMKRKIRDLVGAPVSCILLSKMFNKNQHKKTVRKKLKRRIREPAGGPVSANQPFPPPHLESTHILLAFLSFWNSTQSFHNSELLGIMVSFERSLLEKYSSAPGQ